MAAVPVQTFHKKRAVADKKEPEVAELPEVLRKFLPDQLEISGWEDLELYFSNLQGRLLETKEELEQWLFDFSELSSFIAENYAWRYIRSSVNTRDEAAQKAYEFFVTEIEPRMSSVQDKLNRKLLEAPALDDFMNSLDPERHKAYSLYLKQIRVQVELFRESNIPVLKEEKIEIQKFAEIAGAMMISFRGEEMTLHKALVYLQENDRKVREEVLKLVNERRFQDVDKLNDLFNRLIALRSQIAGNAGFGDYTGYMFAYLCRFDYTPDDCMAFHSSIEQEIVPLVESFQKDRKESLGLEVLKPWDLEVDPTGKPPLKPFDSAKLLVENSIRCFYSIHPYFGRTLELMRDNGKMDLEARKGKAPGGYNYPLFETGLPFIFMNAVGTLRDVITLVHEGGHAVHAMLSHPLEFSSFKETPSEISELASMGMELISMEHWEHFFQNPEDLKRARLNHLESILSILPWVAAIDQFQHWIYSHPSQTTQERTHCWEQLMERYSGKVVDFSDLKKFRGHSWQKQLHLYQVPFYYIEYGFAQLGAIALWRNYLQQPDLALRQYMDTLKLGYTRPLKELYQTAGIRFDFSREYIRELALFVKDRISIISAGN